MEHRAVIHRGTVCGKTVIDPKGISFPSEVPVFAHGRDIVGVASGFVVEGNDVVATVRAESGVGLSPAISGRVLEFHVVDGVRHVTRFHLQAIALVPQCQTDTEPLS